MAALDRAPTHVQDPAYWRELFQRYGGPATGRVFLVAERDATLAGYIVGEVRAWEFGSPPCGWVFAVGVRPDLREGRIGSALFEAICTEFRRLGVDRVRTMVPRDYTRVLSFFRSQGMRAGPYIQLENALDEG